MYNKVLTYVQQNNMLKPEDSVIAGISGGADSVCLLMVLSRMSKEIGFALMAVHVNHHMRGADADGDQSFVEQLCRNMDIPFTACDIYPLEMAKEHGYSIEEAGRIGRYAEFDRIMRETGANKIAVAHNKDDNAETIMLNLFRGSGIKGLSGMQPVREKLVRPLLCVTRAEIEIYLENLKQNYRTDMTNLEDEYTRNKVRHNILAYANEYINSQASANIVSAAASLNEIEDYLSQITEEKFKKLVISQDKNHITFDKEIVKENIVIKKRLVRKAVLLLAGRLKDICQSHIEAVVDLMDNFTGKQVDLPYGLVAEKLYDGIRIAERGERTVIDDFLMEIRLDTSGSYDVPGGSIKVSIENIKDFKYEISDILYTKEFDCDKIKNGLVIRRRQKGDYIEIASGQTQKLKSYLINEKVHKDKRSSLLVLADGSHILWVIGYRISNAYKVTPDTKKIIRVTYTGEKYE
ncbi:MAG: tRNA lysidine(34) synthetase TilS [Eubacterium sp.]